MANSRKGGITGSSMTQQVHNCLFCDKVLGSQHALKLHINEHTGERPYSCPECGDTFTDPRKCWRHRRKIHKLCGQPDRKGSQKHSRTPTAGLPTKSGRAGKPTRDRNQIPYTRNTESERLYQVVFENDKKRFQCTNCFKIFSSSSSVIRHQGRVHSTRSHYKCEFCGVPFTNNKVLWQHKKSSHADQVTVFPCSECAKAFVDKRSLKRHQNTFHSQAEVESLQSKSKECSQDNDFPEINLEEFEQWNKRMEQEYEAKNRSYQERLSSFIWTMNKYDKNS